MLTTTTVIPCFNHGKWLQNSVASALRGGASEVIVVNDGSTDDTESFLACFKHEPWLKLISQSNQGSAAARNIGFRAAQGELVMFLDADDELVPGAISKLEKKFSNSPDNVGMGCGWVQLIDRFGISLHEIKHPQWSVDHVPHWFIPNSGNHLISKRWGEKCIAAYGYLYDTNFIGLSENAALWCRLYHIGCRAFLEESFCIRYRQHAGGSRSTVLTETDPRQGAWDVYSDLGYDPDLAKAISILTKVKRFHPTLGVSASFLSNLFSQTWFASYIDAVGKYEDALSSEQKKYWGELFDFFTLLRVSGVKPTLALLQQFLPVNQRLS